MHGDYILLDAVFLVPLCLLAVLRRSRFPKRHAGRTLLFMSVLTVIFDNLIIAAGIVRYNLPAISGIRLGWMPIEDFAYTLAAVILVALLWERGDRHENHP